MQFNRFVNVCDLRGFFALLNTEIQFYRSPVSASGQHIRKAIGVPRLDELYMPAIFTFTLCGIFNIV